MYFVAFGVFLFCPYVQPFPKCRIFPFAFSHLPAVVCLSQWVPVKRQDNNDCQSISRHKRNSWGAHGYRISPLRCFAKDLDCSFCATWRLVDRDQKRKGRQWTVCVGRVVGTVNVRGFSSPQAGDPAVPLTLSKAPLSSFLRPSWRAQDRKDWHSSMQWWAVLTEALRTCSKSN